MGQGPSAQGAKFNVNKIQRNRLVRATFVDLNHSL